ncbi:hypothetical protein C8P68_10397 [Mucilaginibacter yixingensis]|uniref:Lipocalin-like protein n=1 Tax=Mucilaginibacter yixingensis TaxID=1295612 RepID=A0A2T5JAP8_9SPHI|nr:hypothetical protein C8P68_10397 [Mucilaginibacter yixingensis]
MKYCWLILLLLMFSCSRRSSFTHDYQSALLGSWKLADTHLVDSEITAKTPYHKLSVLTFRADSSLVDETGFADNCNFGALSTKYINKLSTFSLNGKTLRLFRPDCNTWETYGIDHLTTDSLVFGTSYSKFFFRRIHNNSQ